MRFLKNLFLLLASVTAAIIFSEGALWSLDLYTDLANSKLQPGNTVWTRPFSTAQHGQHPDLQYKISIVFDNMGVRNNSGINIRYFKTPIGLFGDSFTENRRLEERFSITSLLNDFWKDHFAINFGIDGFGLEQSFQRYLNYRRTIPFEDVVYVFCDNDLRNLYEVQLFDLEDSDSGPQLTSRYTDPDRISVKHRVFRYLGRFRLTYLVLDGYYRLKGKLFTDNALAQIYSARLQKNSDEQWRSRYHNEYADSIVREMLSGRPTAVTEGLAEKFALILKLWKQKVESDGARFHIAVLPRRGEKALLPLLLGKDVQSYSIIDLKPSVAFPQLERFSTFFENNGHWNEVGNLAAVPTFVDHFSAFGVKKPSDGDMDNFLKRKLVEIIEFYKAHHGYPALNSR